MLPSIGGPGQGIMRMKRRNIVVAAGVLVAVTAVVYFLRTGQLAPSGGSVLKSLSQNVDLQVKNVHYTDVSESGAKWEVRADTARYVRNENITYFDKVAVRLIMTDGKEFELHADRGNMKTDTRDMNVTGNVVIVSNNGDRFTTDHLAYSHADKRFHTDAPVEMANKRTTVKGTGMWLSLAEGNAAILSGVHARIK